MKWKKVKLGRERYRAMGKRLLDSFRFAIGYSLWAYSDVIEFNENSILTFRFTHSTR